MSLLVTWDQQVGQLLQRGEAGGFEEPAFDACSDGQRASCGFFRIGANLVPLRIVAECSKRSFLGIGGSVCQEVDQ